MFYVMWLNLKYINNNNNNNNNNKHPFGETYACFGCEAKTGAERILVIFQDRLMFSHINQKVSARAFH